MKVSFEQEILPRSRRLQLTKPTLTAYVINHSFGILKNERHASVAMMIFSIFTISLSVILGSLLLSTDEPVKIERLEDTLR